MRRLLAASGLLIGALLLAACGGGGSSAGAAQTPAATSTPPTSADTALAAYDDCLTQHGVDPSTVGAGGGFAGGGGPNGSRPTGGSQPNGSRTGSRPANAGSIPGGVANAEGSRIPRGTLDPAQQAARDACQSLLPQGGGAANAGVDTQALRLYQSCLADNGVPVSTAPPSSGGNGGPGGGFGGLAGIDRTSPAFVAADAKCRVLLPANLQGFGGGGATSTTPTTSR